MHSQPEDKAIRCRECQFEQQRIRRRNCSEEQVENYRQRNRFLCHERRRKISAETSNDVRRRKNENTRQRRETMSPTRQVNFRSVDAMRQRLRRHLGRMEGINDTHLACSRFMRDGKANAKKKHHCIRRKSN